MHKINVLKYLEIEKFTSDNIIKVGTDLTIDSNGIASGFSSANYCKLPKDFAPSTADNWEWQMAFIIPTGKTGGALTGVKTYRDWVHGGSMDGWVYYQGTGVFFEATPTSIAVYLRVNTNASPTFPAPYIVYANHTVSLNYDTKYTLKLVHNGSNDTYSLYLNNTKYTVTDGYYRSNSLPSTQTQIGYYTESNYAQSDKAHAFNGEIDLFNSWITKNGNYWWINKEII